MVRHAAHNAGAVSSIPPCVTIKTPLVRKATGNHLIKIHFPGKNSEPCLWHLLRSESSMRRSILVIIEHGKKKEKNCWI